MFSRKKRNVVKGTNVIILHTEDVSITLDDAKEIRNFVESPVGSKLRILVDDQIFLMQSHGSVQKNPLACLLTLRNCIFDKYIGLPEEEDEGDEEVTTLQ